MSEKIKIMIVDDNLSTRDNIRKLIELEPDLEVVCEAATGEEAVRKAKITLPDIILMDINMPGMDGIEATEIIAGELPDCSIIVVSVQGEQEYLRRAMSAGAKDYLVKPFEGDELLQCIRHIHVREQKRREKFTVAIKQQEPVLGKVVTVFSTKGGIGKTTLVTNLSAALGLDPENKIAIIDLNLQFGDIALFLNIVPQVSIADLVKDIENLDGRILDSYMTKYKDNIHVLSAPFRPEQADGITVDHITAIIKETQYNYDYILIDTSSLFNEMTLNVLDLSNLVIVSAEQDLPTLKNARLCIEILESLNYPAGKIKVILNRANSLGGMTIKDSEEVLQRKLLASLPSDGRTVVSAVNQGRPFVISNPESGVAQSVIKIANYIVSGNEEYITGKKNSSVGLIKKALQSGQSSGASASRSAGQISGKEAVERSFWSLS